MKLTDLLYETGAALAANKGRSLLTVLGIVIGISAVIAMTSLIGGINRALVSELGLDQSRVVYVYAWADRNLTLEDLEATAQDVEGYEFVSGMQWAGGTVQTAEKKADASIIGAGPGIFRCMGAKVTEGRLLTDTELAGEGLACVIDQTLARDLFGEGMAAVGQSLQLGNETYTVRGVIESNNMMGGQGSAYIPFGTCARRLSGRSDVDQVIGFAREDADMDALVAQTEDYLRGRLGITQEMQDEGYGYVDVNSIASMQAQLDTEMSSFQLIMTAVAGISLLVGGIGIMNMMLTNVTERIREIGLRKALGARRADITRQFLFESVALCLAGGVIGVAVGLAAAWGLAGVAGGLFADGMEETMAVTPYFSWETALLACAICAGIGILFGFWPARRAAKLDPVESLRYQ